MTDHDRVEAILDGKAPDRIPWIPRLQVWYTAHNRRGTLPPRLRGLSLREAERALGMGDPARDGRVVRSEQRGDVDIRRTQEGDTLLTTYRTPVGTVSTLHRHTTEQKDLGLGSLEIEHMIKSEADIPVVEYLMRNTRYEPTYEEFEQYAAQVGEEGFPLVSAGDCPFHLFLQKLCGYQQGYYLLADVPHAVERLLGVIEEMDREFLWPLLAASPARLILHGVHFDSSLTPPHLFERYITPYYRDLSNLLHEHGKSLCMHADNDSRLILSHIEAAGFDMAETFTTAPQVSCTLAEARQAWGERVIIWGGLPSVLLEPAYPPAAFEHYMRALLRTIAPGDAFILGVADNIMPGAMLERLERVAEMVTEWGTYPIDPNSIPEP